MVSETALWGGPEGSMAVHENVCEGFSSALAVRGATGMLLIHFAAGSERPKDSGYRHVEKSKRNEKFSVKNLV